MPGRPARLLAGFLAFMHPAYRRELAVYKRITSWRKLEDVTRCFSSLQGSIPSLGSSQIGLRRGIARAQPSARQSQKPRPCRSITALPGTSAGLGAQTKTSPPAARRSFLNRPYHATARWRREVRRAGEPRSARCSGLVSRSLRRQHDDEAGDRRLHNEVGHRCSPVA